jgi:hypothetical protein
MTANLLGSQPICPQEISPSFVKSLALPFPCNVPPALFIYNIDNKSLKFNNTGRLRPEFQTNTQAFQALISIDPHALE